MNREQVRTLYDAQPFLPFTMHMADGRNVFVKHREFLAFSPSGRTVIAYQPDESFRIVDLILVTELEVAPGNGSKAKRKRSP